MSERRKRISRRIWSRSGVILMVFALAIGAVIAKLAFLQIYSYDYYKERVVSEITMETEVNPERGTIYDNAGNILATNKTVYLCFISPQDIIDTVAKAEEEKAEHTAEAASTDTDYEDPTMVKPFTTVKGDYLAMPIAQ